VAIFIYIMHDILFYLYNLKNNIYNYCIMTKRVALVLCGNLRTFFYNDFYIANIYAKLADEKDIDVFIYTDNNDFNYNDTQYFSEKNKDKVLGIPASLEKRYYKKQEFCDYASSSKTIADNLIILFKNKLKNFFIEDFNPDQIDTIYDKNNINHFHFMNNNYSNICRKKALMCQFYKLHKCFGLLVEYEKDNNFEYDIIIKSRFDGVLNNLNDLDIRSFDLEKKIYCEGYDTFANDWWAIGNRYIMGIYCNYYLFLSLNMVDNVYCFLNGGEWKVFVGDVEELRKLYVVDEDASDSGEFGLTYLIKHKNNYDLFYDNKIRIDLHFKFYD